MAVNMGEIAIPLSEFYIGDGTLLPTHAEIESGTVVDLESDGVPTNTDWEHIGATIGEGTWEYTRDTIELEIQQVSGIPDGGILYNNDSATMTIPIAQLHYLKLQRALQADAYATTGGNILTVGGKVEPDVFSVLLVAEHRSGAGIFHQFVIYKAINAEGVSLSFSKADGMTYEMSCRGLVDATRPKGDQIGYAFIADIPE